MSLSALHALAPPRNHDSDPSTDGDRTPYNQASSESSFSSNEVADTTAIDDPSVIVGMACRVPGATNVSQLWKNLAEKKDLRRKMPEDRFNVNTFYHPQGTNKGTTNAKYGYFLDQGLDEFDAQFFNISGKEAEAMDPQQRLLLEVVYEALENAGITLDEISGTRTSVYCGSFSNDYNAMTTKDLLQYPKYTVTGVGNAVISNRISYCYNLHGPSLTIDTACSSSLVCFHLGNQSLQSGESDITIVAGSALHFDPTIFITMTDFGMLSADGRCRMFDAKGSGYVRGEGVCAAILKRKSAAEAMGDRIRAVVRATGSNHDGTKDGLTLPNEEAQAQLLLQTYKSAGLSTHDTDYFEAHGTGTAAGDPREAKAIGHVFAPGRERPLMVGSIKSNVGHLEGASGLVGVFKAILSLESGKIVPNMHFEDPNPQIDFEGLKIVVPTEMKDWITSTGIRRASVNSFGYGGSNAHVVLENYVPRSRPVLANNLVGGSAERRPYILPLTSHSEKAGKLLVESVSKYLTADSNRLIQDVTYSYSVRRTMHSQRSFAIGYDVDSLLADLSNPRPVSAWKKMQDKSPRIGFVFTGQGAQWYAMGRQLLKTSSLFRQTLEKCDSVLQSLSDGPAWSCVNELLKDEEESQLSRSVYSQPLCAALQLALVELLRSWGIVPSGVVGHSSGEIVAAYAAGILSFENSIICAYYRGLYMSKGVGQNAGAMMAVGMTEAEGEAEIKAYRGRICIAATNSPSSLTLSGDEEAIEELKLMLDERKVFARRLKVEQAFHSHHMVPLAPAFEAALNGVPGFVPRPARCKMASSVTARDSDARRMDAAYWATNMTGMVRYADALTEMVLDENEDPVIDMLLEIGPHPALKGPSKQTLKTLGVDIKYIPSLTRTEEAYESLLCCAGELFSQGYPVDLVAVNSDHMYAPDGRVEQVNTGNMVHDLPTYSWDHGKYWAETRVIRENRLRQNRHTILGTPVPDAPGNHPRWRNYLRQSEIPWLTQHVIDGKVVFPAAGYISMAIEAVATVKPSFKKLALRDVMFKSALTLSSSDAGTEIMLDLQPQVTSSKSSSGVWYRFAICSFDDNARAIEHCHGLILAEIGAAAPVRTLDILQGFSQLQASTSRSRSPDSYYKSLTESALQYGEYFRLLTGTVESGDGLAMAPMTFKPANVITMPNDACILHPTVLDSSLHVIFAAIETKLGRSFDEAFVPTFVRSMSVSGMLNEKKHDTEDQKLWIRCNTRLPGSRVAISDLSIQSELTNDVLVEMNGLEVTALGNETASADSKRSLFFRIRWQQVFEHLGDASRIEDTAELMDIYCHQFPNSKILHITPNAASSQQALSRLSGSMSSRRRFQSFTPFSSSNTAEIKDVLLVERPGLIEELKPEDRFDLVLVSEASDLNLSELVGDDGFIVSENIDIAREGFQKVFGSSKFSTWRKSASPSASVEPLTLVTSTRPSEQTIALVACIKSHVAVATTEITLDCLKNGKMVAGDIISLVSLDEDVFFARQAEEETSQYEAIQKLFTSVGMNIVWLLRGSSNETSNPAQALMLGLARTARSENENIRLVTLDLPSNHDIEEASTHAVGLLDRNFAEDEVAMRDGKLLIPRVEADDTLNSKLPSGGFRHARLEPFKQDRKLTLKIGKVGLLDTLQFEDDEDVIDSELGDDDVEIEVKASALNFRDIAASIGIIDDYRLGDECSGVIVNTGCNVKESEFKKGDRVLAWRPGQGSHRSIVRNHAAFTQKIEDMDFVSATAISGVLTTAYYSLLEVARLQPGEYCLVHAAAGGVGQMAVQIAQMVGAKVIATVGSQVKRNFLKQQFGITDEMIFSSRDDSFVDGVLKVTNGRGCDVALNSLAGDLLHATWSCIARFGRLIEIGKRDIHENTKLSMDQFRYNVSYASVDLITIYNHNRPLGSRLLRECYNLVRDGKIKPPGPIREVPYSEAQRGFRLLQMGKFFGKVVLVPGDEDIVPVIPPTYRKNTLFDREKTYLLVGGLGGIGRSLSEWMLRKGARKLAFLSRSGATRPDAQATVDWLIARKVQVSVFKGDVTDTGVARSVVDSIGDSLAGVFQAAMVLRDTPLAQMTIEHWRDCLYPKVHGTYNLHIATANKPLDFFVCFSSGSGIIGAMAQANYSSANCYLDALMRNRRENGLPGFTMNVGRVGGIGVVAEDTKLEQVMDRIGYEAISEEELFFQVEEAVVSQWSTRHQTDGVDRHQVITGINMKRKDLYWATKSIFRNLYANHDIDTDTVKDAGFKTLAASVRDASTVDERFELLMEAFIEKIAAVLAVPADTIQASNPLSVYGLDSIVAVEFRKWFSKSVNVELALFDILGAKSIKSLVVRIAAMITASSSNPNTTEEISKAMTVTERDLGNESKRQVVVSTINEFRFETKPENIPMSTFQSRMWFLHNILDDPSSLNFVVTGFLSGKPKVDLLQKALDEVVRRNHILRTSYCEGDDFAEQNVQDKVVVHIDEEDFSGKAHVEASLEVYTRDLRSMPLDIEKGEVMKASLVKLADSKYAFVTIFHHIALDSGSSKSAIEQLTQLYNAFSSGQDISSVAAPEISYTDFTLWHQQKLDSPDFAADLAWWKETFSNHPTANKLLPFAHSERPAKAGRERRTLKNNFELRTVKRIKRICTGANVTPFQFLLAAFRAFIHRYTQEDDLTIHMIDGNRPHPELESVLGFFVNVVPLRLRNDCGSSFEALLKEINGAVLDGIAHSQVPFDAIVNVLQAGSNPSYFPLGQVVFNYQMYGKAPKYKVNDFEIFDVITEDIPSACEIALEALEDPERGLDLRLEYDAQLYGTSEMERFFENFGVFLTEIVRDFRQPVSEIKMCGPKEISYLRENCWAGEQEPNDWNGQTIWERIEEVVETQSLCTAIVTSAGEKVTYKTLAEKAANVSVAVTATGAEPGEFVGVLVDPSIDMIAAMMGIVRCRCAYVPLDPRFAFARLAHMIRDTSTSVILVDQASAELGRKLQSVVPFTVLPLSEAALTTISPIPHFRSGPKDPFYVIYTSGSSGKPKGVVVTHENTQAMLSSHNKIHDLTAQDTILYQSSMSFDLSVAQIWGSLTSGACMALATKQAREDPVKLAAFMREAEVSVSYVPATQFALLLEHNAEDIRGLSKFRRALFAGEHLPARLVKAIYDLKTPVTVVNQWGPTETTVQCSYHYTSYPTSSEFNLPIGRPIKNNSHYIVDANLRPVPATVVGEICVGGVQVGSGYINRPDINRSVFLADPFLSESFLAAGWTNLYKTGDKGCFLPNGEMEFKGRISGDKQIKLRGYRIDQAEIENELYLTSKTFEDCSLREVIVVPRKLSDEASDGPDDRQLIAFIVPSKALTANEQKILVKKLHDAVVLTLNHYMLPSGYQIMNVLPKLISGKVDRSLLLDKPLDITYPSTVPAIGRPHVEHEHSEGDLNAINVMIDIFRAVLKLSPDQGIDRSGNFFDLGGQSMLLLRLQSKIKKHFNVKISAPELFIDPTPVAIAYKVLGKIAPENQPAKNVAARVDEIDFLVEATLPVTNAYKVNPDVKQLPRNNIREVLLTGSDSFVGLFTLQRLLLSSQSLTIHLMGSEKLITKSDIAVAFQRWDLYTPEICRSVLEARIRIVPGTLLTPHFSLDEKSFEKLGSKIGAIYHFGSHVSLLKTYSDLKRTNVGSILDILDLANVGGLLSEIHYLSTWSVVHLQAWTDSHRTRAKIDAAESCPDYFRPGGGDQFGYFKSRWVAEMLLNHAASRGFPVSIYRASAITSSIKSQLTTPEDNFTQNMVLDMIDVGQVPNMSHSDQEFAVDFVPVDYLADVIVRLASAKQINSPNQAIFYHVGNPSPLSLSQLPILMASLRKDGKHGSLVPQTEWVNNMRSRAKSASERIEYEVFKSYIDLGHFMFSLGRTKTREVLRTIEPGKVDCPPVNEQYLGAMLDRRDNRLERY